MTEAGAYTDVWQRFERLLRAHNGVGVLENSEGVSAVLNPEHADQEREEDNEHAEPQIGANTLLDGRALRWDENRQHENAKGKHAVCAGIVSGAL